jgi:hypothetical protein
MRPWTDCLVVALVFICASLEIQNAQATPTITVSGSVDGSGVMEVDANSVSWTNVSFGTPTELLVNGNHWNPSTDPTLGIGGAPLVPSDLNDYFVSTDVLSGRDVANAQIEKGHLFIDFADTPNGADNYSIQVSFIPKPPPIVSPAATLHVSATVDGSDVLHITNTSATWSHGFWGQPTNVTLNATPWDTVNNPTLPNAGSTMFLPPGVDLSTVRFSENAGRDTATYQLFPDHIDVYFADTPVGASNYDVTLQFGSVPEPDGLWLSVLGAGALVIAPAREALRRRGGRGCRA